MRLGDLAAAMNGTLIGDCADSVVTGAATDSRLAGPGVLFFALKGSRTDGHLFVKGVLAAEGFAVVTQGPPQEGLIVVDDVEKALAAAASWRRGRMSSTVMGLTGSSGKTSTRMLLCAALEGTFSVYCTSGNLNNHLGLPLTILNAPAEDPDILVLEMGMNHAGELTSLSSIARPDHCLVTNVGTAHMEFFGSREAIAEAKAELVTATAPGGFCVIPSREPILAKRAAAAGLQVRLAGPGGDAWAETDPQAGTCVLHPWDIALSLSMKGEHQCRNAAAAMLMAESMGVPPLIAARAMEPVEPVRGRGRVVKARGITILDESYNANPESTAACLDALSAVGGETGAVLGDMRELGPGAPEYHSAILEKADASGLAFLILVGDVYASTADAVLSTAVFLASDWEEALQRMLNTASPGCTVLVKGSNSLRLGDLVRALEGED